MSIGTTQRAIIPSPLGPLALEEESGELTRIRFLSTEPLSPPQRGVLREVARQIEEYFAGARREFSIPMKRPPEATPFRNRVWDAMLRIPYGETRTYGELATELGSSARAIGGACGRNPLPIVIPCHRVVARTGIGGYGGDWETGRALDIKAVLLELESRGQGEDQERDGPPFRAAHRTGEEEERKQTLSRHDLHVRQIPRRA